MKPLLQATLMLLILLCGLSCQKKSEDDPSLYVSSTGPGYFSELKATDARQVAIYRETESPREENRAIMTLNDERLQLACRYAASTPDALRAVRNNSLKLSREQMMQVYDSLTPAMQRTQLGKSIKAFTKNSGVLVGDVLPHFEGVGPDGQPFDWSVTERKRVLLIYEGWGWIKRSTHLWFKDLFAATDRDSLAVVAYVYAASLAELQKRVQSFQLEPYLVISDLKGKEGPLDKKMGVHGVPTYYYTDSHGRVRRIVSGFDPDRFTLETGLSPEWGESWTDED